MNGNPSIKEISASLADFMKEKKRSIVSPINQDNFINHYVLIVKVMEKIDSTML